jgi:N6-adenosine-specific RNA methylase IME4
MTLFQTVCSDPPWSFKDKGSRFSPDEEQDDGEVRDYETMSLEEIKDLGSWVRQITDPDSMLYLWAPNTMVIEGIAQQVALAWGYTPKQLVTWVKTSKFACTTCGQAARPHFGGGHYTRVCTEQLMVCRRGKAKVLRQDIPGIIYAPRQKHEGSNERTHSVKPDVSYRLIEALSPGPYVELFARRQFNPQWSVWGNQVVASQGANR